MSQGSINRGMALYSMNSSSGRLGTLPPFRLTCERKCPLISPGMAIKPVALIMSALDTASLGPTAAMIVLSPIRMSDLAYSMPAA